MGSLTKSGKNGHEATLEYPTKGQIYAGKPKEEKRKEIEEFLEKINNYIMTKHLLRHSSFKSYKENLKKMTKDLEEKTYSQPIQKEKFENEMENPPLRLRIYKIFKDTLAILKSSIFYPNYCSEIESWITSDGKVKTKITRYRPNPNNLDDL